MKSTNLVSVPLFLLLLMTLIYLVWVSVRGLDITDEGYYLTASQYPYEVYAWPNVAHIYTNVLFSATNYSVAAFRMVGIVLTLVSGIVFSIGFLRAMRLVWPQDVVENIGTPIALFLCIGTMLCYTVLITPNYNTVNAFALTLSSGLVFGLLGLDGNSDRRTVYAMAFFAGLCVGISFFVKFPTAILLIALYSLLFLVWPGFTRQQRGWLLGGLSSGIVGWLCFHFLVFQSPQEWYGVVSQGIKIDYIGTGHRPHWLLPKYLLEIYKMTIDALYYYWALHVIVPLGFVTLGWLRLRGYKVRWLPVALVLVVFLAVAWQSYLLNYNWSGIRFARASMRFYAACLLLLLNTMVCSYWYVHGSMKQVDVVALRRKGLIVLVLFTLPFVGAMGTNNPITLNMTINLAPWFGLLALALVLLSVHLYNRSIFDAGMLLIGGFACSQLLSSGLVSPYHLNAGLLQQTVPTEIGVPATWLKLDPASSEFFVQIRSLAAENGFKPGDDVLGFFDIPGVIYVLGGKAPGVPWTGLIIGTKQSNELGLATVKQKRLKHAFILMSDRNHQLLPDFKALGIEFPQGYVLCGQATWPLTGESISLWKPINDRSENEGTVRQVNVNLAIHDKG